MNKVIKKNWRDAASLIVLTKQNSGLLSKVKSRGTVNYDILLQTRTHNASFANSVVFPGGVREPADGADRWLELLATFGYTHQDFATLHRPDTAVSPIFQNDPIRRHIELRITAIRETFEELGLLLCSQKNKKDKSGLWADSVLDIDVKYWQKRLSSNPEDLYNLCKEYNCYPDIWSLHYWSNWLTPVGHPKRFDSVFFVTALENKPNKTEISSEVATVEWSSPLIILNNPQKILFPPQVYELNRLSHLADIEELVTFARERSGYGTVLFYPTILKTKDGFLHILPGDELYPSSIDFEEDNISYTDKTLLELRESCKVLHRLEKNKKTKQSIFILQNYKPENHINMGDQIMIGQMYGV